MNTLKTNYPNSVDIIEAEKTSLDLTSETQTDTTIKKIVDDSNKILDKNEENKRQIELYIDKCKKLWESMQEAYNLKEMSHIDSADEKEEFNKNHPLFDEISVVKIDENTIRSLDDIDKDDSVISISDTDTVNIKSEDILSYQKWDFNGEKEELINFFNDYLPRILQELKWYYEPWHIYFNSDARWKAFDWFLVLWKEINEKWNKIIFLFMNNTELDMNTLKAKWWDWMRAQKIITDFAREIEKNPLILSEV